MLILITIKHSYHCYSGYIIILYVLHVLAFARPQRQRNTCEEVGAFTKMLRFIFFINITTVYRCLIKMYINISPHLSDTGRIVSWGWNEHGNCGTGTDENVQVPTSVGMDIKQTALIVGTGAGHSFALISE